MANFCHSHSSHFPWIKTFFPLFRFCLSSTSHQCEHVTFWISTDFTCSYHINPVHVRIMKATAKVKEIAEPLVKKNCALRCGQRLRFLIRRSTKPQTTKNTNRYKFSHIKESCVSSSLIENDDLKTTHTHHSVGRIHTTTTLISTSQH